MKVNDVLNEATGSGTAYWISPKGEILDTSGAIHIDYVVKNPERFGLTSEYIKEKYAEYGENTGQEGKAREEIIKRLINRGWIRLRQYKNSHWSINVKKLNDRTNNILQAWSEYQMSRKDIGPAARDRYMPVKITTMGGKDMETKKAGTVLDISKDKLFSESKKGRAKKKIKLKVVETVNDFSDMEIDKDLLD